MFRGIIMIGAGIAIIIFNAASESTKLVLKGTHIDFGYVAIAIGVVLLIIDISRSSSQKEKMNELKKIFGESHDEVKKRLASGTSAEEVVKWLEDNKNLNRGAAVEFVKVVAREIKSETS
jgi:mannitol/fructose-specific phosphotransferase system IIA component